MLEVFLFIFSCISTFIGKLFTINMGFISLGALMATLFIVMPALLSLLGVVKEEISDYSFISSMRDRDRESNYSPKHAYKPKHGKY